MRLLYWRVLTKHPVPCLVPKHTCPSKERNIYQVWQQRDLSSKHMRLDLFLSGKASESFLTGCAPSIAFPNDPSQWFYESRHSPALKTHSFYFPVRYGCGRDCNMDGCAWKCVEACVVKVKGLKQRQYSFVPSTGLVPEQIQTLV